MPEPANQNPEPTTLNPADPEAANIVAFPTDLAILGVADPDPTPHRLTSTDTPAEPARGEPPGSDADTGLDDFALVGSGFGGLRLIGLGFEGFRITDSESDDSGSDDSESDGSESDEFESDEFESDGFEPIHVWPAGTGPRNSKLSHETSVHLRASGSEPADSQSRQHPHDGSDLAAPDSAISDSAVSDPAARPGPTNSTSAAPQPVPLASTFPHLLDNHVAAHSPPEPPTTRPDAKPDGIDPPISTRTSRPRPHKHDNLRLARAYLMRVAEPPATALLAFIDAVGPVEAAAAVRAAEVPPRVLAETAARRHLDLAENDLADAQRVGARLVIPEDEEWPAWPLLSLDAATDRGQRWAGSAIGLWARGPAVLSDTFERAVSVVGARAATGYGEYVAADIAHGLAAAGMTVVSGAAYGIDGCAHRGALAAEGTTVAVLGCGVDVGYPAGHATLLDRIAEQGLVLSEYPPGTPPARHRFLVRNRLIAALSSGTVVVEAGIRSGARNTATTAAALGKVVLAVPGPITSATSAGCHDLLRTGTAMLAGSVAEVLEAVGPVGEHLTEPPVVPARRTDGLADEALRVHEALHRRHGRTPAQVAVESGVPIERVRALLPELELTGLVERCEEGWRQAPEP